MDRAGGGDGKNRGKRTPAGRQPPHATWISNPYARNNRVSKCTWHVTTLPPLLSVAELPRIHASRVNLIRHRVGFRDSSRTIRYRTIGPTLQCVRHFQVDHCDRRGFSFLFLLENAGEDRGWKREGGERRSAIEIDACQSLPDLAIFRKKERGKRMNGIGIGRGGEVNK